MINKDFLKRLTRQVAAGNGGWYPKYMFYLDTNAQLVLSDKQVSTKLGLENVSAFNSAFAPNGANAIAGAALEGARCGFGLVFEHTNAGTTAEHTSAVAEVTGGIKRTAVIQNFYSNAGPGAEALQESMRAALVAVPLDPAIPVDPVPHPLNYTYDVNLQLEPDFHVATPNVSQELAQILNDRMRDTANEYSVPDNPYTVGRAYGNISTTRFLLSSSNLDVDDESKIMRLLGNNYGYAWDSTAAAKQDILRILLTPHFEHIATLNANCVLLIAEGATKFYLPVLAHLSAGRVKTPGVSGVYTAPWYRPSCHILGFSPSGSSGITPTSPTRAPRNTRTVVTIDRGGVGGSATYKIEKYLGDVIETTLTSHLPRLQVDGSEAQYFTKGKYIRMSEIGRDEEFMLQPVSFASAQEPESPWLYYVSMDEDFRYWLNRQELGKAHVSESLLALDVPPLQMQVIGDRVFMLYGNRITVFRQSTSATQDFSVGTEISGTDQLTAIAVDREQQRIWVGRTSGVFEMIVTGETVSVGAARNVATIDARARYVALCSLRAVNGYLAWVTQEFERPGIETLSWVVRHIVASNYTHAWDFNSVTDAHISDYSEYDFAARCIYSVGVRSNGDLLVIHSQNAPYTRYAVSGSMSWCRVRSDNSIYRIFVCENTTFPFVYPTYHGTAYRFVALHRIDDNHFTSVHMLSNISSMGWYPYTIDGSGLYVVHMSNRYIDAGHSSSNDYRIDDAAAAIYENPLANSAIDLKINQPVSYQSEQFNQHPAPLPRDSSVVRACDALYALHSSAPIVIDNGFCVVMCGMQYKSNIGVELDWNGSSWVHATAGKETRARQTHTAAQPVTPWLSLAFSSGTTFSPANVFRVDTFPSTSTPAQSDAFMYLGDYLVETASVYVSGTSVKVPAASLPTFYGVDIERTESLACVIGGTPLTYVENSLTPAAGEFSMTLDSLVLHASRIGATADLTYNFVKQAEA